VAIEAVQEQLLPENVFRYYIRRDLDLEQGPKIRRLWLAVLQRALQDYVFIEAGTDEEEELLAWFYSPDSEDLGSFRSICRILDVDGDRLLEQLPKISEEGLRGLRKSGLEDVY